MSTHFRVDYSCGHIHSQCRCPSPDKLVTTLDHPCSKCAVKQTRADGAEDRSILAAQLETTRAQLKKVVQLGRAFRRTEIIALEFPERRDEFDHALLSAERFLDKT